MDIRLSLLNSAMNGLFASPRIASNDTETHLRRVAHREGADGRRVAFKLDTKICDYGGQIHDDRYRVALAAALFTNDYIWWKGITMKPSKIVDGSQPNSSNVIYMQMITGVPTMLKLIGARRKRWRWYMRYTRYTRMTRYM